MQIAASAASKPGHQWLAIPASSGCQVYGPVDKARPHDGLQEGVGQAHYGGGHDIGKGPVEHVVPLRAAPCVQAAGRAGLCSDLNAWSASSTLKWRCQFKELQAAHLLHKDGQALDGNGHLSNSIEDENDLRGDPASVFQHRYCRMASSHHYVNSCQEHVRDSGMCQLVRRIKTDICQSIIQWFSSPE